MAVTLVAMLFQQVPVAAFAEAVSEISGEPTEMAESPSEDGTNSPVADGTVEGVSSSPAPASGSGDGGSASESGVELAPASAPEVVTEVVETLDKLRLVTFVSDDVVTEVGHGKELVAHIDGLSRDGFELLGWSTTASGRDEDEGRKHAVLVRDDAHISGWKYMDVEGEGDAAHEVERDLSFAVENDELVLYAQWKELPKEPVQAAASGEEGVTETTPVAGEPAPEQSVTQQTQVVEPSATQQTQVTEPSSDEGKAGEPSSEVTPASVAKPEAADGGTSSQKAEPAGQGASGEYSLRLLVGVGRDGVGADDVVLGEFGGAVLLGFSDMASLEAAEARYAGARFVVRDGSFAASGDVADVSSDELSLEGETASDNPLAHAAEAPVSACDVALVDTGVQGSGVVSRLSVLGDDGSDDNGHGTAMLQAILSENADARVMSVKALDASGHGSVASVYCAIELAVQAKAPVVNLSLSARASEGNAAIEAAIADARAAGCVVVAAAGNRGNDASLYVPGSIDGVICVGALSADGGLLPTSNWGDAVDGYVVASSTSLAAARVSGHLSLGQGLDGWSEFSVEPRSGKAFDDDLFGDFTGAAGGLSTEGRAVAVFLNDGTLVLCRTTEQAVLNNVSGTSGVVGTYSDVAGNSYTGRWFGKNLETIAIDDNASSSQLRTGVQWYQSYRTAIRKVVVADGQAIAPTNMSNWFNGCSNLTSATFGEGFDFSHVTSLAKTFYNCSALTSVDMSHADLSSVTTMNQTFRGCSALTSVDLSGTKEAVAHTDALTNFAETFYNCSSLTSLDLSGLTTGAVTTMSMAFYNCSALEELDISAFSAAQLTDATAMFDSCASLETIWCDNDWSQEGSLTAHSGMFSGCTSLVGGVGAAFDSSHVDKSYARVDADDVAGYFSSKPRATVTFDGNGATSGSVASRENVAGRIKLPANGFTRTNAEFLGWAESAEPASAEVMHPGDYYKPTSENPVIYAVWGVNAQVTFDANGGSGTMQPVVVTGPYNIPGCSFDPPAPGIAFGGWNTKADGSGTTYVVGQTETFEDDVTLFAQWSGKVRLSYNGNGEDSGSVESHEAELSMKHYTLTKSFQYTGAPQTFVAPKTADYTFEVWGAQGGSFNQTVAPGGGGGYARGKIHLNEGEVITVVVGGRGEYGIYNTDDGVSGGGYNGGGDAGYRAGAGGGATDIRLGGTGLDSRVVVAGGGGGSYYYNDEIYALGGAGGGLAGQDGAYTENVLYMGHGASQSAGGAGGLQGDAYAGGDGSLGQGGSSGKRTVSEAFPGSGAGGGGYYGGGAGAAYREPGARRGAAGGGGSGYVSPTLSDTLTASGNTSFVSPSGGTETGHVGNGYARITYEADALAADLRVRENGFVKADNIFVGWNTRADGMGDAYQPGDVYWAFTDGLLYAQWVSNTGGGAIAVLTDDGDLVLCRTQNTYTNDTTGTFVDIAGNSWTGRVFTNIETLGCRWQAYMDDIERTYVAPEQHILPHTCEGWYDGADNLVDVNLERLDTDSCVSMRNMFRGCTSLVEVDVSMFDTTSVTTAADMFSGCTSLTDVTLPADSFASTGDLSRMFAGDTSLVSVDVTPIDGGAATNVSEMFSGCTALTDVSIDASFAQATNFSGMFKDCTSLQQLDISSLDTRVATSMGDMFANDEALRKVTLGENFRFDGASIANDVDKALLNTHTSGHYTGSWMRLPDIDPAEMPVKTAIELRDTHTAGDIVGTWVWEPVRWIDVTVDVRDSVRTNSLAGATFTLSPSGESGKYVDEHGVISDTEHVFTTDADGKFGIEKLRSGTYVLHQVSTTEMGEGNGGYEPIADATLYVVDDYTVPVDLSQETVTMSGSHASAGTFEARGDADNVFDWHLVNRRVYDLPEVGGRGAWHLLVLGGIAAVVAFGTTMRRRKTM